MAKELTQLYRHYDKYGKLLYVGISLSAVARLSGHKQRSRWYQDIARIEIENHESRQAAVEAEAEAIRSESPLYNKTYNGGDIDQVMVDVFIKFARSSAGFKNTPRFRLHDGLFEVPEKLCEHVKQEFLGIVDRRGENWVKREAAKRNTNLLFEYVEKAA